MQALLEHVALSTPPVRSPLPVPEAADEDDYNRRGLAVIDAMLTGQITAAQANQMLGALGTGCQIAHGATLGHDIRQDLDPVVPAPDRPRSNRSGCGVICDLISSPMRRVGR